VLVFYGGPINRTFVLVVHSTDYRQPETVGLDEHVAVTTSAEVIVDMGQARGPKKSLVAFGYTSWAPGQLEIELARHDWFLASGEPARIFDDDRKRVWEHAIARSETDL
jgi:putative transcriptional regulator